MKVEDSGVIRRIHTLTKVSEFGHRANRAMLELEEVASLLLYFNETLKLGEFNSFNKYSIEYLNGLRGDIVSMQIKVEEEIATLLK